MLKKNPHFKKNLDDLEVISASRLKELEVIEREAIANYAGNLPELAKAIGMLHLGDQLGWRVLVLMHSKSTIRKYESILDIKVKDFFIEEGPIAHRSLGLEAAKAIGNFWKVVSGDKKVKNKANIE